ncbi:MAG: putative thiol:disulfide interchange protein DsbC precursor [Syntrophorhabdus sp. PtaB.Bin184]|nr:MAG: putative thiol:disulfide interchange protein DsbC precursor [Syntrophorhabdus sp. PtaB.Bin184]
MKKKHSFLYMAMIGFGLSLLFVTAGLCAEAYEEAFKKAYPQIPFDSMRPTPVRGLYEVSKGGDIIYFFEEKGLLFVGEIIDGRGRNLTEDRKSEMLVANVRKIPLDKAIRIGNGKQTVIEFTDPDCPYCRRAASYLESRKDLTRYVFFFPLPSNRDAENKIKHIFCSPDRAKAYEEAMKGKLDTQKYTVCKKQEATELLNAHKQIGGQIGVSGTPMFIINGKDLVIGANFPAIEAALNVDDEKVRPSDKQKDATQQKGDTPDKKAGEPEKRAPDGT